MATLIETNCTDLGVPKRGKVRDIYDLGKYLLIVTTDRLSAFDVVLPDPIPAKGIVLNNISINWFKMMEDIIGHHLMGSEALLTETYKKYPELMYRSVLVKKANPLTVECIVRGYLTGSGLKEYKATGSVCGIKLPPGLTEASRLPEPIFTPSTKAKQGEHDENISFEKASGMIGRKAAEEVRNASLAIYKKACAYAEARGIIIADTKLEFGVYLGKIILIDEVLTPDSSRFWPKDGYQEGVTQRSFDKQGVRDYLKSIGWDEKPPAPRLPQEVIADTTGKYMKILNILFPY